MHKLDHAAFVAQLDAAISPSKRESGFNRENPSHFGSKNLTDLPQKYSSTQAVGYCKQL